MHQPIFLEPIFKQKIWGGDKIKKEFGYQIDSHKIGECWGVSGYSGDSNIIINGPYQGMTLRRCWEEHREIFGDYKTDEFPLLLKIIDAQRDLSVQVHPDDQSALKNENYPFGKNECWYILSAENGARIIYGHRAKTKQEFLNAVGQHEWEELLIEKEVKTGDFIDVPSGTVHSIGEGIVLLEIQQSSDITYRLYDFNRVDEDGNQRELHIDRSIESATIPHTCSKYNKESSALQFKDVHLLNNNYFSISKHKVSNEQPFFRPINNKFEVGYVIEGDILLCHQENIHSLLKGTSFILPANMSESEIKGEGEFVLIEACNESVE